MKFLALDFGGVLDGGFSAEKPSDKDLLISRIDSDLYQVLKDGMKTINQLSVLVNKHGYKIISHSKKKEADQIKFLEKLNKACQKRGLTFPKFTAIAVRDSDKYKGFESNCPVIIKNRSHGIWIAGYDKELDGKACVRNALSKLLNISETSRKHHIVLDDGPSIIVRAKLEGWQAYQVGEISFAEIVNKIYEEALQEEMPQTAIKSSLFSSDKFKVCDEEVKGGSSDSIQFFQNLREKTKWIGKCSGIAICVQNEAGNVMKPDPVNELKEYLAGKLYACFGVNVPDLTLSQQPLSKRAQNSYEWLFEDYKKLYKKLPADVPDLNEPRLHLMGRFVDGFTELGENFLKDYQAQSKESYYRIQGLPLRGFGRALAVATLLYDYDCIGNSGGNMGYIIKPLFAEIVKIDAGEALPFVSRLAEGLFHDPESRDMLIGPQGFKISFEQLNKADQREFVLTVKKILEFPEAQLIDAFKDLRVHDKRFEKVFSLLLERKSRFLDAFSPEVRKLLVQHIQQREAERAEKVSLRWDIEMTNQGVESQIAFKTSLVNAHVKVMLLRATEKKDFFGVPIRSCSFVGREQDLKKIDEMFEKIRIVCLVGSGGLGKTSLAIEYAYQRYQRKSVQVVWLYAEHTNILSTQMQKYLEKVHGKSLEAKTSQDEIVKEFYDSLVQGKTCLIIDGVQNAESIASYIPKEVSQDLDILITSRFKKWEYPILNLATFNSQLALAYLEKKLEKKLDSKDVQYLTEKLGGLPLGFAQSVAYIRKHNLSLSEYCSLFDKEQGMILSQGDLDVRAVATTLTLALNELKQKNSLVSTIISCAAYLSGDNISLPLLESFCHHHNDENRTWLGKFFSFSNYLDESKIQSAVQLLIDYSIFSNNNGNLGIHRMTQSVVRSIHMKKGIFEEQHQKVVDWLLPLLDYDRSDLEKVAEICILIPHALTLNEIDNQKLDPQKQFRLWFKIGRHQQYSVGNHQTSKICFEKALAIADKHFEEDLPEIGVVLNDLGAAYGFLGDYEKKKELVTRALDIAKKHHGKDHSAKAATLTNLGNTYGSLGDHEKKRELLTEALAINEKYLGSDHTETGTTLASLGTWYRLWKARRLCEEKRVDKSCLGYFRKEMWEKAS